MKRIITIIIGIIIIIIGIVVLATDKDSHDELDKYDTDAQFMERLSVQHAYRDGKHTIYGSIASPTPCHTLEIDSRNEENDVYIDMVLREEESICDNILTSKPFIYSFEASEDANFIATYNGNDVILNILEIKEGEDVDLDKFILKG
jgi:hypothetical protein